MPACRRAHLSSPAWQMHQPSASPWTSSRAEQRYASNASAMAAEAHASPSFSQTLCSAASALLAFTLSALRAAAERFACASACFTICVTMPRHQPATAFFSGAAAAISFCCSFVAAAADRRAASASSAAAFFSASCCSIAAAAASSCATAFSAAAGSRRPLLGRGAAGAAAAAFCFLADARGTPSSQAGRAGRPGRSENVDSVAGAVGSSAAIAIARVVDGPPWFTIGLRGRRGTSLEPPESPRARKKRTSPLLGSPKRTARPSQPLEIGCVNQLCSTNDYQSVSKIRLQLFTVSCFTVNKKAHYHGNYGVW